VNSLSSEDVKCISEQEALPVLSQCSVIQRLFWCAQARQKWHITADKGFASSSNARNELMLRDAGEFAGHIKRCEKDIRILKNATEGEGVHKCVVLAPSKVMSHFVLLIPT